jgi:threonine/homoserine/homoserine lactone efflux protein
MGQVVGGLLPLALGVAISPIPIIAVILMLLARKAGGTGAGFVAGWVVGIAGATTVVRLLADTLGQGGSDEPSAAASWVELGLGALLVGLAVQQWRSRPTRGSEPALPKWMAAIDRFTAVKAAGLGLALSALNPKNLLLCIAAGAAVADGGLSAGQDVWSVVVFTAIAASTVVLPVVAYTVGRKRMAGPLESLRTWLTAHGVTVMATLLLVIGAVLIGQGLGGMV